LLKAHEARIAKALKMSKEKLHKTIEERKEGNLKKEEEVRKRLAE
jgi:hypothetical protein